MSGVNPGIPASRRFGYRSICYPDVKMFAYRSMLQEAARPAVIRESRRAPWLAVSVVCFGAFMGQLDASIVTITFPAMEHSFRVSVAEVQWVSLVYLLGLIAMR